MLVVAARTGEQRNTLNTISTENKDERTRLDGQLGARLQVVQGGNDFRDVACALVLFVVGEQPGGTITEVGDVIADGSESFDEAGAKDSRGFLSAGGETCGAGRCANKGKLVRLTDDSDRQSALLVLQQNAPGYGKCAG